MKIFANYFVAAYSSYITQGVDMNKKELMQSVANAFDVDATVRGVAESLGLSNQAVQYWADEGDLPRSTLRGVAGDFVRRGVKLPADIVKALKAAK